MKIGEFSKQVGLSISTLRYYEDQGFLHIERQNGIRNYHAEDVGFVQFIKRLKDMGMPLANIKRYADLRYAGSHTVHERMTLLQDHYRFIEAEIKRLEGYKNNLEDKLELYETLIKRNEIDQVFYCRWYIALVSMWRQVPPINHNLTIYGIQPII